MTNAAAQHQSIREEVQEEQVHTDLHCTGALGMRSSTSGTVSCVVSPGHTCLCCCVALHGGVSTPAMHLDPSDPPCATPLADGEHPPNFTVPELLNVKPVGWGVITAGAEGRVCDQCDKLHSANLNKKHLPRPF